MKCRVLRVDKRTNMRLLGVFGRVRETIRICCRNTRCPFSVGHEQCSNIGVVSHRVVTKGWLWYGKQRENSGSYLSYQLQDYDGGCRCQKDSEHWHVGFGIYMYSNIPAAFIDVHPSLPFKSEVLGLRTATVLYWFTGSTVRLRYGIMTVYSV